MNTAHRFGLAAGIVVLSAILGALAAPSLPDQLVTNWDAGGEPGGTMDKPLAIVFIPLVMAGLLALLAAVPRIDPLRENIQSFRRYYDWFVVILTLYLGLVHAGIIAFNLGYEFPFMSLVLSGTAILLYYTGVVVGQADRNWFVGIRTPWTLSSDEVWDRTHQLGGRLFKLTAVIAAVGLPFGEYAIYFLVVPVLLTAGITLVYSYYLYEQIEREPAVE